MSTLISVDVPLVASYTVRGYLAPLDEYFTKDEIEKTWVKPSWQAGMYKGNFMAAPQNSSSQFFYINRKLFQQSNVTPPKALEPGKETTYDQIASIAKNDRWTWDQVVDAAKKLTKDSKGDGKIDVWGFEFDQVSRLYQLQCLGESLGRSLVSPDGLKAEGYLNSDAMDQGGSVVCRPIQQMESESKKCLTGRISRSVRQRKSGDVRRRRMECSTLSRKQVLISPLRLSLTLKRGHPVTGTGSWHVGIAKGSIHKAEAAKFAKFLTEEEQGSKIWFETQGQLPATQELADGD